MGVEPTNNGFANRRLRPLGYAARLRATFGFSLHALRERFKKICRGFAAVPHRQFRCIHLGAGWYTEIVLRGTVRRLAWSVSLDMVDLRPAKEAENDGTADRQQRSPP